jgi:uncharacterized membrane-anchored protein
MNRPLLQYQPKTNLKLSSPTPSTTTYNSRGKVIDHMHPSQRILRKVPEITIFFWVVKLLTTAMGESTSDFLVFKINPYVAVVLGGVVLVITLLLQLSVSRYIAWVYWLTVAMVAVAGTMAADVLHIELHIPYLISTIFFGATLLLVFVAWYKSEKTLSIHSINSRRREMFYWTTVMATFALGTAAGDLTAITLSLGYFSSGLLFAVLIALPALGYWHLTLMRFLPSGWLTS